MKSVNKVILIGRLGRDPELRYTPGGQPYAKFSIATDDVWQDKNGERKTRTEWHNIVAWGKLAETCNQYMRKGRLVYIEGRIQTRQWEDNAGAKRSTTEIIMQDMSLLESRAQSGADTPPGESRYQEPARSQTPPPPAAHQDMVIPDEPITDDDVPF